MKRTYGDEDASQDHKRVYSGAMGIPNVYGTGIGSHQGYSVGAAPQYTFNYSGDSYPLPAATNAGASSVPQYNFNYSADSYQPPAATQTAVSYGGYNASQIAQMSFALQQRQQQFMQAYAMRQHQVVMEAQPPNPIEQGKQGKCREFTVRGSCKFGTFFNAHSINHLITVEIV